MKTITISTILVLSLIALLLGSISCGSTPYIQREFDSKATDLLIYRHQYFTEIVFSNGQVGCNWATWIEFQQNYKDKCFHVITHEPIRNGGPAERYKIVEITEIPCSDNMDESIEIWNSWENE